MRDPEGEGDRWLRAAGEDLALARHSAEGGFHAAACLHAQQAAEKAVKAVHYARGARTVIGHNVRALVMPRSARAGPRRPARSRPGARPPVRTDAVSERAGHRYPRRGLLGGAVHLGDRGGGGVPRGRRHAPERRLTHAARNLTGPPEASLVWLAAWAEGLATNIVVALRPELDRVLFAQRRDGTILAGGSAPAAIEPDVWYRLEVRYDGTRFVVSLDGEVLFDEPSAFPGEPFGTVGFGARGAEVEVEGVWVVEGAGGGLGSE